MFLTYVKKMFFAPALIIQIILQNYKYPLDTSPVLHYNTTQESFFSVFNKTKWA